MRLPIYLDNNSTTPVDPRVLDAMLPWFSEHFGNAASRTHPYGWTALEAVENARKQVAALADAEPSEVVFTSGATEAINIALQGAFRTAPAGKNHIISCVTEHSAVLDTLHALEKEGAELTILPVSPDGSLEPDQVRQAIRPSTLLVSLMHANNEIGIIHPIGEIGRIAAAHSVLFHSDAAQSFGKIPLSIRDAQIGILTVSAHKIYGPKGCGALIVRRATPRTRLAPIVHGGGHEKGLRSGTLNVPAIVGFGVACRIAAEEGAQDRIRIDGLREMLWNQLREALPNARLNGAMEPRLPGNLNVGFGGIEGQNLLATLRDHVSVSMGSACTSAKESTSHVLAALGVSPELIHSSLRFGIGRFNTAEEIAYAADHVIAAAKSLTETGEGVR